MKKETDFTLPEEYLNKSNLIPKVEQIEGDKRKMTEEEKQFNQWFDDYADGVNVFEEADMKQAYLQGRAELVKENAELRNNGFTVSAMTEQQLKVALEKGEQLEKENAELQHKVNTLQGFLDRDVEFDNLQKENAGLKEQLSIRFEFEDSWKREKEELEKENAELKEKLNKIERKCRFNFVDLLHDVENESKQEEQLTKAKELLNEFMRISKASDEDFEHDYSELIGEAEQLLSEVEKL